MKKGNIITDFSSETIGERLERLRKEKGYVVINGKETKLTQEVISMDILQLSSDRHYRDYINGKTPIPVDRLCTLANLYNVSVDYLLCRIHYKHVGTNEIIDITGLTEDSIENIKDISSNDLRYNVTTDMVKFYSNGKVNLPHINTLDYLNVLLSSEYLETILNAVGSFMNSDYNIPVHYQGTKPHVAPGWYVDDQKAFVSDNNCIALAKNTDNLDDNKTLPINDTFLETIALKDIEKALYEIKKGCP